MADKKRRERSTVKTVDGITFDLNRVTRREALGLLDDDMSGASLAVKVIIDWPFEPEISLEGFDNLGFGDSNLVMAVILNAATDILEKKS